MCVCISLYLPAAVIVDTREQKAGHYGKRHLIHVVVTMFHVIQHNPFPSQAGEWVHTATLTLFNGHVAQRVHTSCYV
jgi:hypothetical protein